MNEFFDHFPENDYSLCNFYGSTELSCDVTYFVYNGKDNIRNYTKVPIGKPISNTTIHILNADGNSVSIGGKGEIFVSGANLAYGYVNNRDTHRFIQSK